MNYFLGFTTTAATVMCYWQYRGKCHYRDLCGVLRSHVDDCYEMIGKQNVEIDNLQLACAESKMQEIKSVISLN